MPLTVNANTRLLFIGDSITDCGRRTDPDALGGGYVRLVRDHLAVKDPANCPAVLNLGISGNKVTDLRDRWARDVLEQKPDVLSVMIGINDVWHSFSPTPAGVSIEDYLKTYHVILRQVQGALPNCLTVLCEPTVIWPPAPEEGNKLLQPYIRAVHEVGREFGAAVIVPTHSAFQKARAARPEIAWTNDGVHPSSAGHYLIARTWLAATGLV
jgi:lysophospholipase L1-like esterase